MKKLTILVDMDDTMENFCVVWVNKLNKKYGTCVHIDDIKEWDIHKFFPELSKDEIFSPLFCEDFWKEVRPLDGAVQYIEKLINDGHKIIVVTASHPDTVSMKWHHVMQRYFPFIDCKDIIVTAKKQVIKGDVLIDDAPHNLIGGEYMKILYDAPHNKNFDTNNMYITRVYNWNQIYNLIQSISE